MSKGFYEEVMIRHIAEDPLANCRSITLQVTDDCCLNCSYCYQTHKGHYMMSRETSTKAINLLFKMYDRDEENAYINHHTKGLILEFMGGEPFMNIEIMNYATQYFIDECIRRDHPWLFNFRISISSNGLLYFDPRVQDYLNKFGDFVSLGITIDGPEQLHDACRKDYAGNGSFKQAFAAFKHYQEHSHYTSTKITIAPENLEYLDTIYEFFHENKCDEMSANPVFEHPWTPQEASVYYTKLKTIADFMLTHENDTMDISLFDEKIGRPMPSTFNDNWCGGTGAMLAFDCYGRAYPCTRYMGSSLGDSQPPITIGDVYGIYKSDEAKRIRREMACITRRSQSTDECFNCPVADGCAYCSAYNYQETGSVNKRSTNICWMHRARALANSYYWNMYYRMNNREKRIPIYLDRTIATQIISNEEYDILLALSLN